MTNQPNGDVDMDRSAEIEKNPEAYFARARQLAFLEAQKQILEEREEERSEESSRATHRIRHKHLASH